MFKKSIIKTRVFCYLLLFVGTAWYCDLLLYISFGSCTKSSSTVVVLREYSRAFFRIHGRTHRKLVAVAMVIMVYYGGREECGGARLPRNRDIGREYEQGKIDGRV